MDFKSENSVRQALGRIRNMPRFIWVAAYGFNQVGKAHLDPLIAHFGTSLSQLNIRLLQQSDFDALDDLEMSFQAESLLCWAKMAVAQCLNGSVSRICAGGAARRRTSSHRSTPRLNWEMLVRI